MTGGLADDVLKLARRRSPADRERLLEAVAAMSAQSRGKPLKPRAARFFEEMLLGLATEAEHDIRRRLAEKLADADWAPPALINVLALDEIEIARPIIAASPVLSDQDLVRVLVEATIEHRIAVAQRPGLHAPVVETILAQDEPAVLAALAGNDTAQLTIDALERLVEAARRYSAVRAPLARNPQLTETLALRLYAWVGSALRDAIMVRFRIAPTDLEAALNASIRETVESGRAMTPTELETDRRFTERRLVAKLEEAGQLRPSYLLKALKENRLSLFEAALCTLGDFSPQDVRRAVDGDQPEGLALACAAIGIDRGAFPTILELVRGLNGGLPGGGAEGLRLALGAFGPFSPDMAAKAFRQAVGAAPAALAGL